MLIRWLLDAKGFVMVALCIVIASAVSDEHGWNSCQLEITMRGCGQAAIPPCNCRIYSSDVYYGTVYNGLLHQLAAMYSMATSLGEIENICCLLELLA